MDAEATTNEPKWGAGTLAAAFALLFAAGLYALHFFRFPLDSTILETHVRALNLESTRFQTAFYLLLLGLFATICAVALLAPNSNVISRSGRTDKVFAIAAVIGAFALGAWSKTALFGFVLFATVLAVAVAGLPHTNFSQTALAKITSRHSLARGSYYLVTVGVVIYITVFLMGPLTTPLLIQSASELRGIEGHYAVTVLPGFDLICCSDSGMVERASYGLGIPLLSALSLKAISFFGGQNTELVQAVKLNQLIAALLICALSFITNKKYSPYIAAVALGVTTFTLSNVGIAVGYPNQSGIRFIPLLLSLILLALEFRRPEPRVWVLASAAGILVLLGPEMGLVATAGYAVAALLKRYDAKKPLNTIVGTLVGFGSAFIATWAGTSIFIAGQILKKSPEEQFQFVALFLRAGYGGMVDKPSVTAILLIFVATTVVLRGVDRARRAVLSSGDAYEAAVGTMMLIWMLYYVNRMAEWNLWFQLILLVFLFAPRATLANWPELFHKPLSFSALFTMIVACLIGSQLVISSVQFVPLATKWVNWQRAGCGDGAVLDGKCLPWLRGSDWESQMSALIEGYLPEQTLVLTGASTYVRLHGFNEGFPWYDPMEPVREREVEELAQWIESRGPKYVLADDPKHDVALAAPEHSRQIQMYLPRLRSYREVRRSHGWIVLERGEKSQH